MGMFDLVNFECECPDCGATIKGFQSKSGDCVLKTVEPWTVSNFYTSCNKCQGWIEYSRTDYLEGSDKIFEFSLKADKLLRKIKKDHEELNELRLDTLEALYEHIETTPFPEKTEWLDLYQVKFETKAARKEKWDKYHQEWEAARAKEDQEKK